MVGGFLQNHYYLTYSIYSTEIVNFIPIESILKAIYKGISPREDRDYFPSETLQSTPPPSRGESCNRTPLPIARKVAIISSAYPNCLALSAPNTPIYTCYCFFSGLTNKFPKNTFPKLFSKTIFNPINQNFCFYFISKKRIL